MLDFHTHILPEMDDGSHSVDESYQMLKAEAVQGITKVVATPHFYAREGSPTRFLERREAACRKLAAQIPKRNELPLIYLGAEVHYFDEICSVDDLAELRIVGTPLLLLEMPMTTWTRRMIGDVKELASRPGFQIVLAHIDRYLRFIPRGCLEEMIASDILIQANTSFFCGFGTKRRARAMLEQGQIHFVGSDCHNTGTRAPNWQRIPQKTLSAIEAVTRLTEQMYFS